MRRAIVGTMMMLGSHSVGAAPAHEGFVDLAEHIPGIVIEARYAGHENFMARPVNGYNAPKAFMSREAADRLKLIQKEVKKRGWLNKDRVRRYDDAGVHPDFAGQLCRVGAYFSAQSKLTAPLTRNFESAGRAFKAIAEG